MVYKDETFWLTQKAMAALFDCSVDNISLHLKNIYDSYELEKNRTIEDFSIVQKEGNRSVKRSMEFYNLDAIIAVGYRVNSKKAQNSGSGQQKLCANTSPKVSSSTKNF